MDNLALVESGPDGRVRGHTAFDPHDLDTAIAAVIPSEDSVNLDGVWDAEWKEHLLEKAMERVKASADGGQFQIFQLHVLRNIPAREVAKRLGVKLPEVYFAKYKISAMLRKQVKLLETRGV